MFINDGSDLWYRPRYGIGYGDYGQVSDMDPKHGIARVRNRIIVAANESFLAVDEEELKAGTNAWESVSGSATIPDYDRLTWDGGRYLYAQEGSIVDLYDVDDLTAPVATDDSGNYATVLAAKGDGVFYRENNSRTRIYERWGLPGDTYVPMRAAAWSDAGCERVASLMAPNAWPWRYITSAQVQMHGALMGQVVVSGEIIRAAIELYSGAEVPDGYLDHVYGVRIDGNNAPGALRHTQTLAAAGVADAFSMRLPGAIHIQVDAELGL